MFEHSEKSHLSLAIDLTIAIVPIAAWAIYLFGGRAAVLLVLTGISCLLIELPVYVVKKKRGINQDFPYFSFITGLLAACFLPQTVPLWLVFVIAALIVLCRSFTCYFKHRFFNSAVFGIFVANLLFPSYMERYTEPFAYFPALEMTPDPSLVEEYRVFSPLQLISEGVFYEDGAFAQFYGFASGPIGTVAILCLVLALVWLLIRKIASIHATVSYLVTIFILAAAFAPDDIEMVNYALLYMLSGGIVFISVFGMNDYASVPMQSFKLQRVIFGLIAAALTFVFRLAHIGILGDCLALLCSNLLTPLLEKTAEPGFIRRIIGGRK